MRYFVDPASARVRESRKLSELPGEPPEAAGAVMRKSYRYAYLPTVGAEADVPDRGAFSYKGPVATLELGIHFARRDPHALGSRIGLGLKRCLRARV